MFLSTIAPIFVLFLLFAIVRWWKIPESPAGQYGSGGGSVVFLMIMAFVVGFYLAHYPPLQFTSFHNGLVRTFDSDWAPAPPASKVLRLSNLNAPDPATFTVAGGQLSTTVAPPAGYHVVVKYQSNLQPQMGNYATLGEMFGGTGPWPIPTDAENIEVQYYDPDRMLATRFVLLP